MINTLPSYTVAQIVTPEAIETLEQIADELEQVVRVGIVQSFGLWEKLQRDEEGHVLEGQYAFCTLSAIYERHAPLSYSLIGEDGDDWHLHRNDEVYRDMTGIDLTHIITYIEPDPRFEEAGVHIDSFLLWLNDSKKMPFTEQVVYLRQLASEYRACLKQEGIL